MRSKFFGGEAWGLLRVLMTRNRGQSPSFFESFSAHFSNALLLWIRHHLAPNCRNRFVSYRPLPPPKRVTTNIGLKQTYIPPGSFTMGADSSKPGAKPAEKPHRVTISKGLYMGIHEVTQDQYLRVMGKNPSVFQEDRRDHGTRRRRPQPSCRSRHLG